MISLLLVLLLLVLLFLFLLLIMLKLRTIIQTDLASENLNKGKSILGAPLKLEKKEAKNPKAKNDNS